MSDKYEQRNRPVGTWITTAEYELFCAIAQANHVKPAAYLRAMISDVIYEESAKLPPTSIPRRKLPDLFLIEAATA